MKNLFIRLIFTLSCGLLAGFIYAQQGSPTPHNTLDFIPPSPTAAGLGEYGNVPVSLYTGKANISVPIYNLQTQKMTVPISLSYASDGIKVDAVASSVGLNWSLNAGGVITRSIRGMDDTEGGVGFTNVPDDIPTNANSRESAAKNQLDAEPDQFFFNVNGYAGSFTFDRSGQVLLIPYQDVLIARISADQWQLTTPDGIKYIFGGTGKMESSHSESLDCSGGFTPPPRNYVTSWYLSQIIHPEGEVITFNYAPHTLHYTSSMTQTRFASSGFVYNCSGQNICQEVPQPTLCSQTITISGVHLSNITASTGSIDFNYDTGNNARLDVNGGVKLTDITIKGAANNVLQTHSFTYDYYTTNTFPLISIPNSEKDYYQKRLKLKSVTQIGSDNQTKPPTTFHYLDELSSNYEIPARLSAQQDSWGYANANPFSYFVPSDANVAGFINGADRSADEEKSLAGLLYQVDYPLGGHSKFDYELHEYGSLKTLENLVCEDALKDTFVYPIIRVEDPISSNKEVFFTIDDEQFVTITGRKGNADTQGDFTGTARIFDANGQEVYSPPVSPTLKTSVLKLIPQTYRIYLDKGAADAYAEIKVRYTKRNKDCRSSDNIRGRMAGGARIQRITDFDGKETTIRRFVYTTTKDDTTRSSGVLIGAPIYRYTYNTAKFCGSTTLCQIPCSYFAQSSSSQAALGSTQGSHVGYTEVHILYGENGQNGKTSHHYSYAPDKRIDRYPFGAVTNYDWKRGLLLKQESYDKDGLMLQQITNEYDFRENKSLKNRKVTGYKIAFEVAQPICPNTIVNSYEVIAPWYY